MWSRARSVAPGALPAGCPGPLAAGCPLVIANLAGHGYLSVALVACFWALLVFQPDLSAFLLPFLALSAFFAGFGRGLFFRGGPVFLACLLIGVVVSSCRLARSLPSSSGPSNDVANAVPIAISSTAPIPTRTYGVSSRLKVPPSHATPALD